MKTTAILASLLFCAPALQGADIPAAATPADLKPEGRFTAAKGGDSSSEAAFHAAGGIAAAVTSRGGLSFGGAEIDVVAYAPGWERLPVKAEWISAPEIGHGRFTITGKDGKTLFRGRGVWAPGDGGSVTGRVEISCVATAEIQSLAVAANIPAEPSFGLGDGSAAAFDLPLSDGRAAQLVFAESVPYHAQDSRPWGGKWSVRFGKSAFGPRTCTPGDTFAWDMTLSAPDGVSLALATPIEITEGPDWTRLDFQKDVEPGSALDFSDQGLQDAPAGKHGWLKAVGGHFEFEDLPGVEQRFYGVNLCFSANYPDHDVADRLVDRLVRSGYNALRVHHHDGAWAEAHEGRRKKEEGRSTEGTGGSGAEPPVVVVDDIDRLDYLLARCFERGIYVTTDLYVSRKALWRDIGIDRDGTLNQNLYKTYVGCHDGAFADWCRWTRAFLEHVNPYIGRAYKDEPGLPLISLINEGILAMGWDATGKATDPVIRKAWEEYTTELFTNGNCSQITIDENTNENGGAPGGRALPVGADRLTARNLDLPLVNNEDLRFVNNPNPPSPGTTAFNDFDAWLTRRIFERCSGFVRSLGCRALLTNDNNGRLHGEGEGCTPLYDYVDSHFYVDHPTFIDKPWALPSKCGNDNLIKADKPAIFHRGWAKGASKPYTISEWNIAHPGLYRGMGGILTGALAAEQEWDGLWRFAYSHSRDNLIGEQSCSGYFDCVADPLIAASDRASVCLFLRGDASVAAKEKSDERRVTSDERQEAGGPALHLDKERGSMALVTPRTCGGFAESGRIEAGPLSFTIADAGVRGAADNSSLVTRLSSLRGGYIVPTTLWVSSLDDEPLERSRRILLTHLTDVQGEGAQFADEARRILLQWGKAPLVRTGAADVELRLSESEVRSPESEVRSPESKVRGPESEVRSPEGPKKTPPTVWALDTAGRRVGMIPSRVESGVLRFRVCTAGPRGGCLFYEIVP